MMTSSPPSSGLTANDGPPEHLAMFAPATADALSVSSYPGAPAAIASNIDRDMLFAEFAPLVRRLIRQYAGEDFEMRQDMRGEIYYRFSLLLDEWDPARGVPLRPYLVRKLSASAYTFARHHWRRDKRELSMEFGEEMGDQGPSDDPTDSWDHALALEKVLNLLPEGITQLPRRQRQLVVWRYYEQRSFEEIAERLDIRVATARSILRHGMNNLRRWIQREKLDWEA
jgi:RNA polymerase sigma factor (sigma-70 family)